MQVSALSTKMEQWFSNRSSFFSRVSSILVVIDDQGRVEGNQGKAEDNAPVSLSPEEWRKTLYPSTTRRLTVWGIMLSSSSRGVGSRSTLGGHMNSTTKKLETGSQYSWLSMPAQTKLLPPIKGAFSTKD